MWGTKAKGMSSEPFAGSSSPAQQLKESSSGDKVLPPPPSPPCSSVDPQLWGGGGEQASFIRAILQRGGVWVGGSSAGWVGRKLWTPTPLILPRVSWVGLLPHLLSLVTGALSGCLLVPFSALSLCRWQVWLQFGSEKILPTDL